MPVELPDQGRVRQESSNPGNFLPITGLEVNPRYMVTDSHHWLKTVGFFPSNFAGFSIFSLVVLTCSSVGHAGRRAAAIPAPTNRAISSSVSMVASRSWVGSSVLGGGLPIGRFRS